MSEVGQQVIDGIVKIAIHMEANVDLGFGIHIDGIGILGSGVEHNGFFQIATGYGICIMHHMTSDGGCDHFTINVASHTIEYIVMMCAYCSGIKYILGYRITIGIHIDNQIVSSQMSIKIKRDLKVMTGNKPIGRIGIVGTKISDQDVANHRKRFHIDIAGKRSGVRDHIGDGYLSFQTGSLDGCIKGNQPFHSVHSKYRSGNRDSRIYQKTVEQ
ncbi:hypothetical protein DSECCO2_649510 [anaerobic digester metagenome]